MRRLHLYLAALTATCGLHAADEPVAARAEPEVPESVVTFLTEHLPAVHKVQTGTQIRFNGRFIPLPDGLRKQLRIAFPDRQFLVADMSYLHWGFDPVKLLLVVRRLQMPQAHGSVKTETWLETYVWALWFSDEPFSFGRLLGTKDFERPDIEQRMKALAGAIAFVSGDKVGECQRTEDRIAVVIKAKGPNGWNSCLVLTHDVSPDFYRLSLERCDADEASSAAR